MGVQAVGAPEARRWRRRRGGHETAAEMKGWRRWKNVIGAFSLQTRWRKIVVLVGTLTFSENVEKAYRFLFDKGCWPANHLPPPRYRNSQ